MACTRMFGKNQRGIIRKLRKGEQSILCVKRHIPIKPYKDIPNGHLVIQLTRIVCRQMDGLTEGIAPCRNTSVYSKWAHNNSTSIMQVFYQGQPVNLKFKGALTLK